MLGPTEPTAPNGMLGSTEPAMEPTDTNNWTCPWCTFDNISKSFYYSCQVCQHTLEPIPGQVASKQTLVNVEEQMTPSNFYSPLAGASTEDDNEEFYDSNESLHQHAQINTSKKNKSTCNKELTNVLPWQTLEEFVHTVDSCNIDLDTQKKQKKQNAPIKIWGERKASYNISG